MKVSLFVGPCYIIYIYVYVLVGDACFWKHPDPTSVESVSRSASTISTNPQSMN